MVTLLFTSWLALPKVLQITFEYSNLKAHISNTENNRNKRFSDSASRYHDICTSNTCAKLCAKALFHLPLYYTGRQPSYRNNWNCTAVKSDPMFGPIFTFPCCLQSSLQHFYLLVQFQLSLYDGCRRVYLKVEPRILCSVWYLGFHICYVEIYSKLCEIRQVCYLLCI